MPVVSVLLVFHRDTPFLRTAVDSVLRQTWTDWELVLVDNGTRLAADALGAAGRDPRLRWVRLPENRGIPAGHNAGLAAARGEFVALLDHDDVALPRRLEAQVARLQAEPALGLVSSLAETIDESGRVVGREFALGDAAAQRAYAAYSAPVVTPAYAGRRELFERLGYRPEFRFAADFDFLARAADVAPMAAVPEVLLQYRRHRGQTTQIEAGAIEDQRAAIRYLAAQRRSGASEDLARVTGWLGGAAATSLTWARRALAGGFAELAAYQARRAVTLERTPGIALGAAWCGGQAIARAAAAERARVARMFFSGPVKALGLRPLQAPAGRADA